MRRALLVLALGGLLAGCGNPSVTLLPESDLPPDVYGSPRPTPFPTAPAELPRRGTVFLVHGGRLLPVRLPLQGVPVSLPEALLLALLQGPPNDRTTTEIPPETRINDVVVEGRVALVDLSSEFDRGGLRRSLALRLAQVVYTVTEEPSDVIGVRFAIDGIPTGVIGGVDLTAQDRPVTRADYRLFAPPEETPV